jgi:hypothetical protein
MTETVVYDTGPLPLILRFPVLLIGLVCVAIAVSIPIDALIGPTCFRVEMPHGPIVAFLGSLTLGLFLTQLWFARNRVVWDEHRRTFIQRSRLLGIPWNCEYPANGLESVRVRRARVRASTYWVISLVDKSSTHRWLTRESQMTDAVGLAERIGNLAGMPVEKDL